MKNNNYLTHGIHPYHAKFIPDIPKKFIKKYSKPNDYVLDPFCGSGTTLLEALLLDRNSFGIDLNNIAYKISKAKIFKADVSKLDYYYNTIVDNFTNCKVTNKREFPDKYVWYTKTNADAIDKLFYLISKIKEENYRNVFEVIVSSFLKTVSNKRNTWNNGYIADNVLPNKAYKGNVFKLFCKKYEKTRNNYSELYRSLKKHKCVSKVYLKNILDFNSKIKFDIVVTSPPYPFAVDFVKYNRLIYYWFGWNVDKKAEEETGSRTKRNRKCAINDFFKEMEVLYKHIFNLVKKGGYFCMTVADTHRNKEKISFIEWLYKIFKSNGWIVVEDAIRSIKSQSMAQKRIPKEHKLVFKKIKQLF